MLFFYVDESGTGLKDKRSEFFLLSAVAIKDADWQLIDSDVNALKRNIIPWAKPEDFEIKGRDLRRGEKLFKAYNWTERVAIINQTANLIAKLPCQIFAIKVSKRDLPEYVSSDEQMYRLSLWRLLDELEREMTDRNAFETGILLIDTRSNLHSSLQDRRLIDAYKDWAENKKSTRFVELPWFGFSAFYAGLQLADFCAYMIDLAANEGASPGDRNQELVKAFRSFAHKIHLVNIP